MPLEIARNGITKMMVDAIVNAANEQLLGCCIVGSFHRIAYIWLLVEQGTFTFHISIKLEHHNRGWIKTILEAVYGKKRSFL